MAPKAPRPTPHQDALLDRSGIIGASAGGSTVPPRPGMNRSGAAGFLVFVLMVLAGVTGMHELDRGGGDDGGSLYIAGNDLATQAPPSPMQRPSIPGSGDPEDAGDDGPGVGAEPPASEPPRVPEPQAPVDVAPQEPATPEVASHEPASQQGSPRVGAGASDAVSSNAASGSVRAVAAESAGPASGRAAAARAENTPRAGNPAAGRSPGAVATRPHMDRSETADRLAREVRRQVHAAVLRQQNEILERRHAAPVEPRASIPSAEPRDAEPRDAEPRAGESRDAESGDAAPRDIEVGEVEPHDTVARGVDATERTDITEDREVERDEEIDVEIGD